MDSFTKRGSPPKPKAQAGNPKRSATIQRECSPPVLDIGRFKEARQAYETAQRFSNKDPYLASFIRQADSRIAARRLAKTAPDASAPAQPVTVRGRQRRYPDPLAELRRVEAMNAHSRRLMMQNTRPPTPPSAYGTQVPQPGAPNQYQHQPYRPPAPGQSRR